jgi:hypothetical protein
VRALLYQLLINDMELLSLIPSERWIQQGAMDKPPLRPFAVVMFADRPRSTVGSAQPRVTVWVHDERGSYDNIDKVIHRLEELLSSTENLEDATSRIACIRWEASSGDLTDDQYNTNVRTATFSLTGRK